MEYKFREIREYLDLKQYQVAEKLNMSRGAYANIEAETANIKLKDLLNYCNIYNFTMDYVTNLSDTNKNQHFTPISKIDKSLMAERLNILEKEQNKKAQEIAEELGIYKSTYSNYKNSEIETLMQTLMLKKLASKYNYSMDWLVGRSNIKYR